jgi:hypothetical protein
MASGQTANTGHTAVRFQAVFRQNLIISFGLVTATLDQSLRSSQPNIGVGRSRRIGGPLLTTSFFRAFLRVQAKCMDEEEAKAVAVTPASVIVSPSESWIASPALPLVAFPITAARSSAWVMVEFR